VVHPERAMREFFRGRKVRGGQAGRTIRRHKASRNRWIVVDDGDRRVLRQGPKEGMSRRSRVLDGLAEFHTTRIATQPFG